MPSSYPAAPDDLTPGNTTLDHGDVTDAVAAVQATLGVNPQGAAATVAARLGGRPAFLSGEGAPLAGDGMDDLDGVSDPWRWSEDSVWPDGWIGPAYEVSWLNGDEIPAYTVVDDGGAGTSRRLTRLIKTSPATLFDQEPTVAEIQSLWENGVETAQTWTAASDGTGVAFAWYREVGGAHTVVPDVAFDITANLGDVVVGDPYIFADVDTGVDGDSYRDINANDLYGPKDGTWPTPPLHIGFDPAEPPALTGPLYLGPEDDPDNPPLVIAAGNETPDGYLNNSQVAVWYEDTAAAPVIHFKAKDSAGAVYVASLPMTAV